ncbi:MAG: hypothetical protein HN725_00610 [Alphaproteobacteria bacterium]|jgi:hypothetical protein|nr:hypothetical protein [Alphaproteobacteria bacterium]MBT4084642.1 hypothetical protein [Alphaproteobacteria bacterium]MBT4543618.1 hypothetical protein [Alphaproteobacteria bacterium]MBT6385959.1 hypothetical protein [Alphaproteobacteria bacterium]MBT7743759.1 hypothetical protein [Alphaproteobacteria bacterium]
MTIAWFLTFDGPEEQRPGMPGWFRDNVLPAIAGQPGVQGIDIFTGERGSDPYHDDGAGPLMMVQVDFDSISSLDNLLQTEGLQTSFLFEQKLPENCEAAQGVYDVIDQVVDGRTEVQPRTAALSYVVRYFRPAENEKEFTDFYVSHHPQVEAKFPNIRNIYCYLPVPWQNPTTVPVEDCMIGNEVVFDSLDGFNAAMKSDVRLLMREDFARFPPFSGPTTHFAMLRKRVFDVA